MMMNGNTETTLAPKEQGHFTTERWTKHQLPSEKDLEAINALREQLAPGTHIMTRDELSEFLLDPATHFVTVRDNTVEQPTIIGIGVVHILYLITGGKTGRVSDVAVSEPCQQFDIEKKILAELRKIAHEHEVRGFITQTSRPVDVENNFV